MTDTGIAGHDAGDLPNPGLVMCFFVDGRLPPPWFVPIEAPACGAVLHVPVEATNDGAARTFVCDRPAGHHEEPPEKDGHRQVTDNSGGTVVRWSNDSAQIVLG